MELRSFYFDHPQLFIVPVEHLTSEGVSAEFVKVAEEERGLSPDFFALLGEAIAKQHERLRELFGKARRQWFPPRLTNLCIVTDGESSRPYYQPFTGASLLLYASDFDPEISNVEFATYALVHNERLGIVRSLPRTVVGNLGYFIVRSDAERAAFAEAAQRCTRPDADGFKALGEAMAWVGEVLHEPLKPPMLNTDGLTELPGTGLMLTDDQAAKLGDLLETFESAGRRVVERYYASQAEPLGGPSPAERISTFLKEHQPRLLLADSEDHIIWDPDEPDMVDDIPEATEGICDRAAVSICRDLELVSERTNEIFGRMEDPDALPSHGEEVQQEGGVYLHEARKMMVYSLHQPGIDTKREGTPPFHTWLLGARMAHEWGHLAADAAMIAVPYQKQARYDEAKKELAALFDTIIQRAPEKLRDQAEEHYADRPSGHSIGRTMLETQMERMGDYKSNVFAQAVLPVEEMESYVRVNVRPMMDKTGTFLGRLARIAYEAQYLGFSKMADPKHYFFSSTWFAENYIDTGILSREEAEQMLDLMGEICTSHELVEGTLRDAPA